MRLFLTTLFAFTLGLAVNSQAASPRSMNFQGKLTDAAGDPVPDGNHLIDLTIFNSEVGGATIWSEAGVNVTTTGGIFSTQIGSDANPIDQQDFALNDSLWLEIQIGAEILSPRTYLEASPFALGAGSIQGWSEIWGHQTVKVDPGNPTIETFGNDGLLQIAMYGNAWGEVRLFDENPANNFGAHLTANGGNGAGQLSLYGDAAELDIRLSADQTGDNAAIMPPSSVHSDEMLNEPGFAFNSERPFLVFDEDGSMIPEDIITIEITTPATGYILVEAVCHVQLSGTTGENFIYIQIDTTSGGAIGEAGEFIWMGDIAYSSTSQVYRSANLKKAYNVPAGTYTFRMEGDAWNANDPAANHNLYQVQIQATYYPTSYGTARSLVTSASGFDSATPITCTDPQTGTSRTAYEVDLRELEVKAKEARIAALEAELELQRAREAATSNENAQPTDAAANHR